MQQILIVGAGVVGQATGKGLRKHGHRVDFADIDQVKIDQLNEQGLTAMQLTQVPWYAYDLIMLTVSTPTINNRLVLDHLESATRVVGDGLAECDKFVTVVVRSTVPPTTTEQRLCPLLERASGKRVGVDFGLAVNPEFLRQRTSEQDFERPWITVIGACDRFSAETLCQLYTSFGGLIVNCRPAEAEMIKYVHNIYNALKISYFNEVHMICEHFNIDSRVVSAVAARSAEAMWNPLYGTRGGVPYGGACLPKDTTAFLAFCQDYGVEHLMLEALIQVNQKMEAMVAAVASPDEIEQALKRYQLQQNHHNGYA